MSPIVQGVARVTGTDLHGVHSGRRLTRTLHEQAGSPTLLGRFARWAVLMAEGDVPVSREWHAALGLQDCMVVVGGRADIPDFEPIPLSCDTMSGAVEVLWFRPPPPPQAPTGAYARPIWHHMVVHSLHAPCSAVALPCLHRRGCQAVRAQHDCYCPARWLSIRQQGRTAALELVRDGSPHRKDEESW